MELRRNHRRITWEAKPISAFQRVKAVEGDAGENADYEDVGEAAPGRSGNGHDDDDVVDNLIWLETNTLSSFADEEGMINVRVFLEVESKFQRSGWFRFEKCEKCAQWDAIDTDYVFLKVNGNGNKVE